jgi:hypothetical protein
MSARSVVGLLAAGLDGNAVPAPSWALEGALEMLRRDADPGGPIAGALLPLALGYKGPETRLPGVTPLVRGMVDAGLLTAEGSGWLASYRVDKTWVERHAMLRSGLGTRDRRALEAAAQWLVAVFTMLSKKAVA